MTHFASFRRYPEQRQTLLDIYMPVVEATCGGMRIDHPDNYDLLAEISVVEKSGVCTAELILDFCDGLNGKKPITIPADEISRIKFRTQTVKSDMLIQVYFKDAGFARLSSTRFYNSCVERFDGSPWSSIPFNFYISQNNMWINRYSVVWSRFCLHFAQIKRGFRRHHEDHAAEVAVIEQCVPRLEEPWRSRSSRSSRDPATIKYQQQKSYSS